jgi:hypothetical protein
MNELLSVNWILGLYTSQCRWPPWYLAGIENATDTLRHYNAPSAYLAKMLFATVAYPVSSDPSVYIRQKAEPFVCLSALCIQACSSYA